MKKISWFLVTSSTLTLTSCISGGGGGSSSSASSSSSAMSWSQGSFPLSIVASSDFTASDRALLNDMAVELEDIGTQADASDDVDFFSASTGGTLTAVADPRHSNINSYRDSKLGIYKLQTWPSDFSSSALAVTQLWGVRGASSVRITHFDIFFSPYYSYYTDPNDAGLAADTYDMGTIALHELGHSLGLSHITDVSSNNTVMYPYIGISTVKRTVRDRDLCALSQLYGWSTDSNLCSSSLSPEIQVGDDGSSNLSMESFIQAGVAVGETVSVAVELRTDGTCHHIINGHDVHAHKVNFDMKAKHHQEDLVLAH